MTVAVLQSRGALAVRGGYQGQSASAVREGKIDEPQYRPNYVVACHHTERRYRLGGAAPAAKPADGMIVAALMTCLMTSSILLIYALAQLWPEPTPAGATPKPVNFLVWSLDISDEVRLFYLVALTGALGAMVHTLRSLYWYVGNQQLMQQWLPMYLLLPFVSAALSLIFYLLDSPALTFAIEPRLLISIPWNGPL
jgi:hypothetical protein